MKKRMKQMVGLGTAALLIMSNTVTTWAAVYYADVSGNVVYAETSTEKEGGTINTQDDDYITFNVVSPTETITFLSEKSKAKESDISITYSVYRGEEYDIESYEVPFEYDKAYPIKYKDYERVVITLSYYDKVNFYFSDELTWFFLIDPTLSENNNSVTGHWIQDSTGWWYQNSDLSYPKATWKEINNKWYYFNEHGYMLEKTITPDGYKVGADGAWIQ